MIGSDGSDRTGDTHAIASGLQLGDRFVGETATRPTDFVTPSGAPDAAEGGVAAQGACASDPAAPRINCFTPGTRIATPRGDVPIEILKPGDVVVTRDNGQQVIRWVGCKHLSGPPLRLDTRLQPVIIRAGALAPGVPQRDLSVSPNHRVLLLGDHPALAGTEAEVFVSARHLVGTRGVQQASVDKVSYLHFMCDRHEVVKSNGAWTESFQPSETALQGVSDQAREELLELFPDLVRETPEGFADARPTLSSGAIHRAGT